MKKNPDNTCPTCNLPFSFVRCPVTKGGLKECLSCAIEREKVIPISTRKADTTS